MATLQKLARLRAFCSARTSTTGPVTPGSYFSASETLLQDTRHFTSDLNTCENRWKILASKKHVVRFSGLPCGITALNRHQSRQSHVHVGSNFTKPGERETANGLLGTRQPRGFPTVKQAFNIGCGRNMSTKVKVPDTSVTHYDLRNSVPVKCAPKDPGVNLSTTEYFDNCQIAYRCKTTWELIRALNFFYLCKSSYLTDNAEKLMKICRRVIGKRPANFLIRKTVYEQFVAGENKQCMQEAIARLSVEGVGPIMCVPCESDVGEQDREFCQDTFFDNNVGKILESIQVSLQFGDPYPMVQFRITALISGDLLTDISKFCGKTAHTPGVMEGLIAAIDGQHVDFNQLPGWSQFPDDKAEEFKKGLQRLRMVKDALQPVDVIALVDAEYTYLNPAMRLLSLCLMKLCNTEKAKIFYTYQAYLKETLSILQQDLAFAQANGFGFGVKQVRGAYMVKERQLALDRGYDSPVHDTIDQTAASYRSCLDVLLNNVSENQDHSLRFIIATHNEDTLLYAIKRMHELGLPKDGPNVFFGQLYGMADHVSCTLGYNGYRVYKSIPYGPIDDTLPYLARRAQENKAILANARRERDLVTKALRERMTLQG